MNELNEVIDRLLLVHDALDLADEGDAIWPFVDAVLADAPACVARLLQEGD